MLGWPLSPQLEDPMAHRTDVEPHRHCRSLTRHSCLPGVLFPLLGAGLLVGASAAQAQDAPPLNLDWWHPVAAGGAVAATIFFIDEPVRDWMQPAPESLDDLADFAARFKDGPVYWYSAAGLAGIGLAAREPKVAATGVHVITAYGMAGWMNISLKWVFGRTRPSQTPGDVNEFDFFDGGENAAFPSGSAAVVFSLATTLADAVDRTPVSVVLYAGAGLNSWARLHTNRHWVSDVAMGALVGITAAKLVNGEWTLFGLSPPALWTDGRRSGLAMQIGL